jgi:hypothetical protein
MSSRSRTVRPSIYQIDGFEVFVSFDPAQTAASQAAVTALAVPPWLAAPPDGHRLLDPDDEGDAHIYWDLDVLRQPTDADVAAFGEQLRALPGCDDLRLNLTHVQHTSPRAGLGLRWGTRTVNRTPGRNQPCLCGKKYKKCCGA